MLYFYIRSVSAHLRSHLLVDFHQIWHRGNNPRKSMARTLVYFRHNSADRRGHNQVFKPVSRWQDISDHDCLSQYCLRSQRCRRLKYTEFWYVWILSALSKQTKLAHISWQLLIQGRPKPCIPAWPLTGSEPQG